MRISHVIVCGVLLIGLGNVSVASEKYLKAVRAYADAMIEHGRDTYGDAHSPLFAGAMDREKMKLGAGGDIEGIRGGDRAKSGANPMHDENLYLVLYALTEVTGEKRYSAEADRALKWFFENCQSPATGLMAWGEHISWDFIKEGVTNRAPHEFYRPWVLWDRCYALAPDASKKFARGLWEHQIHNHETGEFSRHAGWREHGTGTHNEYPRHGGFYILTWGHAYSRTRDPVFPKAIETLLNMWNRLSSEKTGIIPCSSNPSRAKIVWPESNLSLAIDLWSSAAMVPDELAKKMRQRASRTDELYLKLKHDFSPNGIGFVSGCHADTLETFTSGPWTNTQLWATGYGKYTDAQVAMMVYLRYQQVKLDGFRKLILAAARRYLDSKPNLEETIYPGPMGDVIFLMIVAHELSGEKKYMDRADYFADLAIKSFFDENSPLPRASSRHQHYEAVTRGDTLVMALLRLWQVKNKPDMKLDLVYTDR